MRSEPMRSSPELGELVDVERWSGGDLTENRSEITSRTPTLYEQVLVISAQATYQPTQAQGEDHPIDHAGLELILDDLADCPGADIRSLVVCLSADRAVHEQALWRVLSSQRPEHWEPAVRLLAELGTWRSLPVLEHWLAYEETHHSATRGLARLAEPRVLTRLALVEPDRRLRRQLLMGLLSRGTSEAVRSYLSFVRRAETTADALAAAEKVAQPPADALFVILQGTDVDARLAAAQVLGRFDQREIAQRLARMAIDNVSRQEALVGLLSSPRADASLFIKQARQDVDLMAAVRAAEWQLHSFETRTGGRTS